MEHRGEASSARDLGTTCRGGSAGCTAGELTGGAADGAVVQGGERVSSARGGRKGPRPGGDVGDNPPRAGVGEWKRPRRTRWNAGVLARMRQAVCGGVGRQLLSAPVVMRGGEVVRPLVAGGRWTQGVRVGRAQSLRRVAGQPRMLAEEDEARGRARGAIATAQLLAPRSHPCAAVFAGSRPSLSLADCVERVHGQAGARVAHACCPRRDTAALAQRLLLARRAQTPWSRRWQHCASLMQCGRGSDSRRRRPSQVGLPRGPAFFLFGQVRLFRLLPRSRTESAQADREARAET